MTDLLIFGRTGQVATELHRRQPDATCLARADVDLTDTAAIAAAIQQHQPRAVINAAAYTAVDKAESEEALATAINGTAPGVMAGEAAKLGVPFLHVSTDYVFEGGGEAFWRVEDPIAPLGAYGRSKAAGEALVASHGGAHAILRTSWVFSAHGNNFVKTMLRLAETRDALTIVEDQIGGPTAAADIADALLSMADQMIAGGGESGLYHFAGGPETSWAGFAREIFAQAGKSVTVTGIPSEDYPTPAARPKNSRLDCSRIDQVFDVKQPDWRVSLAAVLKELHA